MRISDWSSDVCSSDLFRHAGLFGGRKGRGADRKPEVAPQLGPAAGPGAAGEVAHEPLQGRAHPLRATGGRDAGTLRLRTGEPDAKPVMPRPHGLLHYASAELHGSY